MSNLLKFLPPDFSDSEWNDEVRSVCAKIAHQVHPISIYIFGSTVSLDRHRGSDIDLCILVENDQRVKEVRRQLSQASLTQFPLDLLIYSEETFLKKASVGGVCQIIVEDGKLLYGKEQA